MAKKKKIEVDSLLFDTLFTNFCRYLTLETFTCVIEQYPKDIRKEIIDKVITYWKSSIMKHTNDIYNNMTEEEKNRLKVTQEFLKEAFPGTETPNHDSETDRVEIYNATKKVEKFFREFVKDAE